jgi:hypothetical protein
MAPAHNIAVYANGVFLDATIPYDEQLAQMRASAFNTVVLWALHVRDGGDLYYNDNLAARDGKMTYSTDPAKKMLDPKLPERVAALRSAGVERIVFSIGPFASDFEAILGNEQAARANFKALIAALTVDTIDFDFEGDYDADDRRTLVKLTQLIESLGATVSYCPYNNRRFWLDCLADVYAQLERQPVKWMFLQCYDGGDGNDPATWVEAIKKDPKPLGIPDPSAFVVPGYWVKQDYKDKAKYGKCPDQLEQIFKGLKSRGLSGGFLWNSLDIFAFEQKGLCGSQDVTPKGYSEAVRRGLQG